MTTPSEAAPLDGDLEDFRAALADKYTIEHELGRGGHSLVFLAQDLQNHRPVAIKILRPELALHVATERFLREIEITAQLQHPHILALFTSGSAAGHTYYVMPYIEGESLDAYLARTGPLPVDEAVRLAGEVAEALQYAHGRGFVHRDIKPGNILLSEGHALVADFGIARALRVAGDSTITGEGTVIGTAAYISPEQAGAADTLDARSDQYALACVVYEMLAGQPPFTGPSLQAIVARHLAEQPPPLRVVRPAVTPALQAAIERGLAKVPGDRWATVAEFAAALRRSLIPAPSPAVPRWAVVTAVAIGVLVLVVWRLGFAGGPELDPKAVVVFPLVQASTDSVIPGAGLDVALAIGNALEHTEPLRWIDGWTWLDPEERRDPTHLTVRRSKQIARDQHARWYIEGAVSRHGDFVTIVLRLIDVTTDSVAGRANDAGHVSQLARTGWRALNKLLPSLLAPDRVVDLSVLTDRDPTAVALWLQGEREYRQSHFAAALGYLRRAVAEDSSLALAALRGAEAAHWEQQYPDALQLANLALAHVNLLPPKYGEFARGLRGYFTGAADSAVAHFRQAVALDTSWGAAWTALGEVYYHLLPRGGALDSLAEVAFLASRRTDPDFAPPLHHLASIAARAGDVRRADALFEMFRHWAPDSTWYNELRIMLDCVRVGPDRMDWQSNADRHPAEVIEAAGALAWAKGNLACAAGGFAAVLNSESGTVNHRWGALVGLQSVLVAQGQQDAARRMIDSAVAAGLGAAHGLYVMDALADAGMTEQAGAALAMFGPRTDAIPSAGLWYRGKWAARHAAIAELDTIASLLARRAGATGTMNERLWADALGAYLALARGDTAAAVAGLGRLAPHGTVVDLRWGLWESLAGERMKLAELLLARGLAADALAVANVFDSAGPITFLLYARASLELRLRAAERLGRPDLIGPYRKRLAGLAGISNVGVANTN